MELSNGDDCGVRDAMKGYWDHWVKDAVQGGDFLKIMVSEADGERAKDIHESDCIELASLLPDLSGMEVLELAGGVGRFSVELARQAKHVVCTDMMESFVKENERLHSSQYSNMSFRTLDATKIDYPPNSFDMITYVWLMLYLNDKEVKHFVLDLLRILRPGGLVFFREAHFTSVGSRVQTDEGNPAIYRSIMEYVNFFKNCRYTDENNDTYSFELVYAVNSRTYTSLKGIPTVVYYLWKKSKVDDLPSVAENNRNMDEALYNEGSVQVYNEVIGDGFTTPGGLNAAKELVSKVGIGKGDRCLDVGCSLGGLSVYLMKEYKADVTGVDLSSTAAQTAVLNIRQSKIRQGQIQIRDMLQASFPHCQFDVIFALDTLKYIKKKGELLRKFENWLKPSGKLLIGDYCLAKDVSNCAERLANTSLLTEDAYMKLLHQSNFTNVDSEDWSRQQIGFIQQDLSKLMMQQSISKEVKESFSKLWQTQLSALKNGEWVYMVFVVA